MQFFEGHRMLSSFLVSDDGNEEKNDYFTSFSGEHTFDMHHIIYNELPSDTHFCPFQIDGKSFLAYANHDVTNVRFMKPWTALLNYIIETGENERVLRGNMLAQVGKFRHGKINLIDAKWIDIPLRVCLNFNLTKINFNNIFDHLLFFIWVI